VYKKFHIKQNKLCVTSMSRYWYHKRRNWTLLYVRI